MPTVYLTGEEHLPLIPEYLRLGSVVVVAPDREILDRWRVDQCPPAASDGVARQEGNVVVDIEGRRVTIGGTPIQVSDLEFRVLAALFVRPGRAWAFRDLWRAGWGEGTSLARDDQTVRALVQRLRNKLQLAGSDVRIDAVRSFGYRVQPCREGQATLSLTGAPLPRSSMAEATPSSGALHLLESAGARRS